MAKASEVSMEERVSLIVESLRSEGSIADLCRKHGISQTTFYKWDKFIEADKGSTTEKARIEELERVIGRQTIEIQILKKNLNLR